MAAEADNSGMQKGAAMAAIVREEAALLAVRAARLEGLDD